MPRKTATPATELPAGLERALPLLEPEARAAGSLAPGGYFDLLGPEPPRSTGLAQDLMLTGVVPRIYERWWRPALGRVAKGVFGPGMPDEHRIARLLLGLSPGDGVLDVACGTGNFTRDFARSVGADGLAVGIDVSETMLTRAVEDTAEAGSSRRPTSAATPRSCRSSSAASTPSAASPPSTSSPTRCGRSTG